MVLGSHSPWCWNQASSTVWEVPLDTSGVFPGSLQTRLQGDRGELTDLLGQKNFIIFT
jgi:hypothetical protein